MDELTKRSYRLRRIVLEAVYRSSSGHIGGDLSVVDILNVLYNKIMVIMVNGEGNDSVYNYITDLSYINNLVKNWCPFGYIPDFRVNDSSGDVDYTLRDSKGTLYSIERSTIAL